MDNSGSLKQELDLAITDILREARQTLVQSHRLCASSRAAVQNSQELLADIAADSIAHPPVFP
jgi:hypothetical protein